MVPQDSDAQPRPRIIERKVKLDGTVREFDCELVHREPGLVVVRFVLGEGGSAFGAPLPIPSGSISDGYFWAAKPYGLYRMRRPDGEVVAHRFDAVTDVVLANDAVTYRDLVLDWWVPPDDTLIEEDRVEFEEAVRSGAMSRADAARANAAERDVYSRYRHIIDRAAAIERRFSARR